MVIRPLDSCRGVRPLMKSVGANGIRPSVMCSVGGECHRSNGFVRMAFPLDSAGAGAEQNCSECINL